MLICDKYVEDTKCCCCELLIVEWSINRNGWGIK